MMTKSTSRKLTIFEGPDGAGKTTAAKDLAEKTRARYVHFSAMPSVTRGLARMYVEAMLPALLGYQDVVFDRSWMSEVPYGEVYRGGADRLGVTHCRMLERLALRCGAVMVFCDPGLETVTTNFKSRKGLEMLDNENQLRDVYRLYHDEIDETALPLLSYDYKIDGVWDIIKLLDGMRRPCHPLELASAGVWGAPIVLVGESFAEQKNDDSFYQWPFASFSQLGCSDWLTEQLSTKVDESRLFWINADQDLSCLQDDAFSSSLIIALGEVASSELYKLKIRATVVPHPQSWKRFNAHKPYPLLEQLPEALCNL